MQELLDGWDCWKERLTFLKEACNTQTKRRNYFHTVKKLYFIIIVILGFLLFHPFWRGGKTAYRPKSQPGCETAAHKCHDHALLPWEKGDWSCRCVPCWLQARCSISELRDSEREERKWPLWADTKTLAFVLSTGWGWWHPPIWGSAWKETAAGEALDVLSDSSSLPLHLPASKWTQSLHRVHLQRKRRWNLLRDPAERICCCFLTQQQYKVLDAPTESADFYWKKKDSSCWNLTPKYRWDNRMWILWIWALELLVIASPLPNCRQLNSED